jgi:hypothetical protein
VEGDTSSQHFQLLLEYTKISIKNINGLFDPGRKSPLLPPNLSEDEQADGPPMVEGQRDESNLRSCQQCTLMHPPSARWPLAKNGAKEARKMHRMVHCLEICVVSTEDMGYTATRDVQGPLHNPQSGAF